MAEGTTHQIRSLMCCLAGEASFSRRGLANPCCSSSLASRCAHHAWY